MFNLFNRKHTTYIIQALEVGTYDVHTVKVVATEEEAQQFCERENNRQHNYEYTYY